MFHEGGHDYRRQHHEQRLDLRCVEPRCGLHAILHCPGVLSEDAAEQSTACAAGSATEHPGEIAEAAECVGGRVIFDGGLDRALAAGLLRGVRHPSDHHGKRGLDRVGRGRGIGAQLLADLLDLIWSEMLLYDIEKRHGFLKEKSLRRVNVPVAT